MAMSLLPVIEMQGTFVEEKRQPNHTHDGRQHVKVFSSKGCRQNEKWSTLSLHLDNRKYLFRPTYVLLLIFHTLNIFSSSQVSYNTFIVFNCVFLYIFCDNTRLTVMRLSVMRLSVMRFTVFAIICHTV